MASDASGVTKKRLRPESPDDDAPLAPPLAKRQSWECANRQEYDAQPLPGWTTTTFPKPNEGFVLVFYHERHELSRYLIPVEEVDDETWAVLISMDGVEFSEMEFHCFDNFEMDWNTPGVPYHAEYLTSAELKRLQRMKACKLLNPGKEARGDTNTEPASFDKYKQYKVPHLTHPVELRANESSASKSKHVTAVIHTGFYYEVEL